ncbi:MAG: hypothetical protein ABI224_03050 [Acetobacteraceae bacterium]
MISKLTSLFAAFTVAGGLALAPVVFAQGTPPSSTAPATQAPNGEGMMNGQGMMNGGGMMHGQGGMMGMMSQMTRMMENCNRMMEGSNMNLGPGGGMGTPPTPDQKG